VNPLKQDDFETVRLKHSVKQRLENLKDDRRRETGEKISLSELVADALDAYEGSLDETETKSGFTSSQRHSDEHRMLEEILEHGEPEAGWITGNLRTFVEKIRAVPTPRKKKAVNG
jgi:hypothetical protein